MDNTFWVRSLAYPVDNDGAGEGRREDAGYGAHSVRDPHKDGGIVGRYIKVVHAKTINKIMLSTVQLFFSSKTLPVRL